jgi:hypothetical protein
MRARASFTIVTALMFSAAPSEAAATAASLGNDASESCLASALPWVAGGAATGALISGAVWTSVAVSKSTVTSFGNQGYDSEEVTFERNYVPLISGAAAAAALSVTGWAVAAHSKDPSQCASSQERMGWTLIGAGVASIGLGAVSSMTTENTSLVDFYDTSGPKIGEATSSTQVMYPLLVGASVGALFTLGGALLTLVPHSRDSSAVQLGTSGRMTTLQLSF